MSRAISRRGGPGSTATKRLRRHRQQLDLRRTIVAGPPKIRTIVYGYSFPSRPDRMKIGYSGRGLDRVIEQSTGFPEKPIVHFVIHDPKAKQLEDALHAALSARQADTVGVEWFDVDIEGVIAVSPHLRKALGVRSRLRVARLAASLVLFCLGLVAVPAILPFAMLVLGEGLSPDAALRAASAYREVLAELKPQGIVPLVRGILGMLASPAIAVLPKLIAVIPAAALAAAPSLLSPRQARV